MKNKKQWVTLAAVVVFNALSAVGSASEIKQTNGEIVSVDQTAGTLTVKETDAASQPASFVIDSNTVISKDKKTLAIGDLKTGESVSVEYGVTPDNKSLASTITIETVAVSTAIQ